LRGRREEGRPTTTTTNATGGATTRARAADGTAQESLFLIVGGDGEVGALESEGLAEVAVTSNTLG
jgi:hypothetical protein